MTSHGNQYSITLPIQSRSLAFAQRVSNVYTQPDIKQRVYNNAVAVATIQSFFEIMGIPSNYNQSDLCNPSLQLAADSSDLYIENVGKIECRWVTEEQSEVSVPYESWDDRVGYSFVSFDLEAHQATIHGFLPHVKTDEIPRTQLRSVEFMLQHLDVAIKDKDLAEGVCLTRWLAGVFEPAWQTLESMVHPSNSAVEFAFRGVATNSPIEILPGNSRHGGLARRAKTVTWQPQIGTVEGQPPDPVVLIVEINQATPLMARVIIQMHPCNPTICLPPQIQFSILDPDTKVIIQATSRSIDNYLQLPFKGEPGEAFQVKIVLGTYQIIENFHI